MNIREYYRENFPSDLDAFLQGSPFFGQKWKRSCRTLERVSIANREDFLICLHNIILFDQAMHFHFQSFYPRFESLTHFPKFCHGQGEIHHDPNLILCHPQFKGLARGDILRKLLPEGMRLFIDDVTGFLAEHIPEVSSKNFFDKLLHHDKAFGFAENWRSEGEFQADFVNSLAQDYAYWATYDELKRAVKEATLS